MPTSWLLGMVQDVNQEAGERGAGEVFSLRLGTPPETERSNLAMQERGLIALFRFAPRHRGRKHSPLQRSPLPPCFFWSVKENPGTCNTKVSSTLKGTTLDD
ncbi:MAG: hypothetical protein ICV63_12830 [Coleofasciculus sp. Co-bin14]|nr:hypothetical protein [Coleofasciculus sp. Co-bin14]